MTPTGIFQGLFIGSRECWTHVEQESLRLGGSQTACRYWNSVTRLAHTDTTDLGRDSVEDSDRCFTK